MFALTWEPVIAPAGFMSKVRLKIAHGALEGVDLTDVGLDLVAELHSLLFG